MGANVLRTPTSRCRLGVSRCNITPPVGIYHRMWGAALHDRSEGVHRPLTATAVAFAPLETSVDDLPRFLIALDHCLFRPREMREVLEQTCALSGIAESQVTFAFSHTHAAGFLNRRRTDFPGGELIPSYLELLPNRLAAACLTALATLQPATLTYATTTCGLGRNRDLWDESLGRYVCGLNPAGEVDQSLLVVRATDEHDQVLATLVNYGCHPTTLAWENRLISPDYVGAMREVIEQATRAPCAFLLSPCGDVGPTFGFTGDHQVADRNGRQLGYAALSALESMAPPGTDYHYLRAQPSGALIGVWEHRPHEESRRVETACFRAVQTALHLPYRTGLPTPDEVEDDLQALTEAETAALETGDEAALREVRARVERQRRLLERVESLPLRDDYPLPFGIWQLGDAFWITVEGEPYNLLQAELRRQFAPHPVIITTIANGSRCSYLPPREAYDKSLYQSEIAVLAPGCLEAVTAAIRSQLEQWRAERTV